MTRSIMNLKENLNKMLEISSPIILKEYNNFPEPIYIPINKLELFKLYYSKFLEIDEEIKSEKDLVKLKLKAKYFIGIIKLPNNKIYVILPKIENAKFFKMLECVEPLYSNIIQDLIQGILPDSNFLMKFIDKFLDLTEVLFRSFIRKNYKTIVRKTEVLRGKIILSKTLKNFNFLLGKIICEYDDFTLDIIENQVIKYALYLVRYIATDKQQNRIRQLLISIETVSLKEFISFSLQKFKYNRFNSKYKAVHTYCKMIIERFSFGFNIGDFECFSMLLNSWDIYEKFLRKIINDCLPYDYMVEENSSFLSWEKDKFIPDIIIKRDNKIVLLCDAKYKLEWTVADRNQASMYLRHIKKLVKIEELEFDINYRNLILIYPLNERTSYNFDNIEKLQDKEEGLIFAHSIDLSRLDDEKYLGSWLSKIKKKFFIS